jgi:hypothetical protein
MLKKLSFKSGVNRENTRYTTEGGYYECDKIRFRQGTPQKIGGWQKISNSTFLGVCRSLWNWLALNNVTYIGVGTNLKFYICRGGAYFDVTPIRTAVNLTNPFTAHTGSSIVTVAHTAHGCQNGDFVTYNGATGLGGTITASLLNREYQITFVDVNTYTIDVGTNANGSDTGHGGTVRAVYQINTGPEYETPNVGWGAGPWGYGTWGYGTTSQNALQLWSQSNFGQDLIFGPRGGGIYYSTVSLGVSEVPFTVTIAATAVLTTNANLSNLQAITLTTSGALPTGLATGTVYYVRNFNDITNTCNLSSTPTGALIGTSGTQSGSHAISPRAINLSSLSGASDVPTVQNYIYVSDTYRFVLAFGCNDYDSTTQDPMLIRWSDQEDAVTWTPSATNQAGSIRLSHGSEIVTVMQTRQELIVLTDSSAYSLQYLGPPYVWSAQLLGDNISIMGQNATAIGSGIVYWMGIDKFYMYDGRVQTLRCDLKEYVFNDFNISQAHQVYGGSNERFNEIWWFYCSANSTTMDRYVVYNYLENVWYYGTMARTAWLDSGTIDNPIAATYTKNIVSHEFGLNDYEGISALPIYSYVTTSEFDLDEDGHKFMFIRRILPDVTFRGSTADNPTVTMSVIPLNNSGSGYTDPASVGGVDSALVTRTAVVPIEEFTGQVFIRVRGRQFSFKIESNQLDMTWQLGSPRCDFQYDGRRST